MVYGPLPTPCCCRRLCKSAHDPSRACGSRKRKDRASRRFRTCACQWPTGGPCDAARSGRGDRGTPRDWAASAKPPRTASRSKPGAPPLQTEARQILRGLREDLTIEEAERLRVEPEAVRIQELGAEYERIATRIESSSRNSRAPRQIAGVESRLAVLAKPRPVDALKRALALAEEALPLEQQLKSVRTEHQALRQACEQGRARLCLSATPLEELGRLQAPALETIRVFEDRFDGLERRLATFTEETRKTAASLSETGHRLEEARLEREVPTEADLEAARKLRGRGWGLIARRLNSEAVSADEQQFFMQSFPGESSLSAGFAASIEQSDGLADRLRREADRVAVRSAAGRPDRIHGAGQTARGGARRQPG